MPTVTVVRGGGSGFAAIAGGGTGFARSLAPPGGPGPGGSGDEGKKNRQLIIKTKGSEDDTAFWTNLAPKEVEYTASTGTFNEATRPDRQPLLRRSGMSLRKMSMTMLILGFDEDTKQFNIETPINDRLDNLEKLAETPIPLKVKYDARTNSCFWHITNLTYRSIERSKDGDEITRAEVTIEFTETEDKTAITLNEYTPSKRPKQYITKDGDTLAKIAKKFYGTDNIAIVKAIGKVNDIENMKRLKVGRKIKLP